MIKGLFALHSILVSTISRYLTNPFSFVNNGLTLIPKGNLKTDLQRHLESGFRKRLLVSLSFRICLSCILNNTNCTLERYALPSPIRCPNPTLGRYVTRNARFQRQVLDSLGSSRTCEGLGVGSEDGGEVLGVVGQTRYQETTEGDESFFGCERGEEEEYGGAKYDGRRGGRSMRKPDEDCSSLFELTCFVSYCFVLFCLLTRYPLDFD